MGWGNYLLKVQFTIHSPSKGFIWPKAAGDWDILYKYKGRLLEKEFQFLTINPKANSRTRLPDLEDADRQWNVGCRRLFDVLSNTYDAFTVLHFDPLIMKNLAAESLGEIKPPWNLRTIAKYIKSNPLTWWSRLRGAAPSFIILDGIPDSEQLTEWISFIWFTGKREAGEVRQVLRSMGFDGLMKDNIAKIRIILFPTLGYDPYDHSSLLIYCSRNTPRQELYSLAQSAWSPHEVQKIEQ